MAVTNNLYGMCKFLLDEGADVNIQDKAGNAALSWSTNPNVHSNVMKLLLDYGADVNQVDIFNATAFNRLLQFFEPIKAQYLLNSNMEPTINAKDTINGNNILSSSIWILHKHSNHGNDTVPICVEITNKLIKLGVDLNAVNYTGNSVIHTAAKAGCYDSVKILVDKGCNVNLLGGFGLAPIHILSEQESFENFDQAYRPFRNLRAMIDGTFQETDPDESQKTSTNLEQALIDCLQHLLGHGADINLLSSAGDTCLHIACEKSGHKFKKAILKRGAGVNITNVAGRRTPLHTLLNTNNPKARNEVCKNVILLIENGADINFKCMRGWNALFYAIFQHHDAVIDLLLQKEIDLEMKDNFGLSALHIAIYTGRFEFVQQLIQYGCLVDAIDMYGSTPLFYAIGFGLYDIAKLLINAGANMEHVDRYGNTVSDIIIQHDEDLSAKEISQLLDDLQNASLSSEKKCTMETIPASALPIKAGWWDNPVQADIKAQLNNEKYPPLEIEDVPNWIENKQWVNSFKMKISNFISEPLIMDQSESKLMIKNITTLMQRISEKITEIEPTLAFTSLMSGSVSEGTKITDPDEFDFLICLDNFQDKIDVIESDDIPPSYCTVKLKSNCKDDEISKFFDTNRKLNKNKLSRKIYDLICKVLSNSAIWRDLGFHWQEGPANDSDTISALKLYWIGPLDKLLTVSVDIVISVSMRNWWPTTGNHDRNIISNEMHEEGCLLIMKQAKLSNDPYFFRISFSKTETNIIRNSSNADRKGYMLAKAIRSWIPLCIVHIDDEEDDYIDAEFLFSSYVLKTCLFEEIDESYSSNVTDSISQAAERNSVEGIAYRIWKRIEIAVRSEKLSSFFIDEYKVYEKSNVEGELGLHGYPNEHAKSISYMIANVLQEFI